MNQKSVPPEHPDLAKFLREWPPLEDDEVARGRAYAIVRGLTESLGEIVRVHIPDSEAYVAVTFANEPERVGAYIHVNFVDHIIEVTGSYVPIASPNYWRSDLSTLYGGTTRDKNQSINSFLCPEHNVDVPKYGDCPLCGWRPLGY